MTPTPPDLAAIRERHAKEQAQRIDDGCTLCIRHRDRGLLLAEVDRLTAAIDAAKAERLLLARYVNGGADERFAAANAGAFHVARTIITAEGDDHG